MEPKVKYRHIFIFFIIFTSVEAFGKIESDEPPLLLKKSSHISERFTYTKNSYNSDSFTGLISIKKSDLHELTAAVRSLNKSSDSIWLEFRPFLLALISAMIGMYSSLILFARQERFKIKQQNVIIANKWLLNGHQLFNYFIHIRRRYRPFIINWKSGIRILHLPSMRLKELTFEHNIAELVFFISEKNESKGWNLHRIQALFENCFFIYQQIDDFNERRNKISLFVKENFPSNQNENLSWDKIINSMEKNEFNNHILLSEQLLKIVDDVIIELKKFIQEVPELMTEDFLLTQKSKSKKKGFNKLVSFDFKDEIEGLLTPLGVNIDDIAKLTGLEKDEINSRLATGYS